MKPQSVSAKNGKPERILSIDALRGIIMILMALDHANSFLSFGYSGEFWGGPLRQFESSAAFLVRFVTHLCAPGFFFLMGVGMIYLVESRKSRNWSDGRIRSYFFTRGLLIIVIHFALGFILGAPSLLRGNFSIVFNVLFILGLSMILTAPLLKMKPLLLLIAGTVSFLIPEFLLKSFFAFGETSHPVVHLLFVPGPMGPHRVFYTLLPWIGFCLFGLAFGKIFHSNRQGTVARIPIVSAAAFVLFLILRTAGGFGNLRPVDGAGWIAFLNMTKYPPSIVFASFMMSVNLILLYFLEKLNPLVEKYGAVILVFGRSALFFYIVHHFIYVSMMMTGLRRLPLSRMVVFWLLGLLIAYPLCKWYAAFKRRQSSDSIWRLL